MFHRHDDMDSRKLVVVFLVVCCAWQVQAAVVSCTAPGRVADTSDTTCQNYTYCVYNSARGTYLAYYYQCPTPSVFNPNTQKCTASTNYVCSNTASDESPACLDEGFFPDKSSADCTSYIGCVALGGSFIETKYTCATGSYFDPTLENCSFTYVCPTVCTAAGRFANALDTTCATFYSCVQAADGSFVQAFYSCPPPSLFNPNSTRCSTNYTC